MRLKVATTALLIFGVLLLLSWPWTVGPKPAADAVRRLKEEYVVRLGVFLIAALIVFFLVAVFAVLVARQTRRELREEAKQNLQELIEGTLRDHEKKEGE